MKRLMSGFVVLTLSAVTHAADSPLSAQEQQGKRSFDHLCVYCHGPGFWGTNKLARRMDKEHAVLENRTDLQPALIKAVVRNGIGSMPPLRKTELSDADLAAIVAYLNRTSR